MGGPGEDLIETERLVLEPIDSKHVRGIFEATVASRPELLPWMPWAREPTIESVRTMLAETERDRQEGTALTFAVIERPGGAVLGVIGLNAIGDDRLELHYWMRTDHAGLGLTTEAGRALLEWAMRTQEVKRFVLWAGRENLGSRRVAEKLGFVHVGPLNWRPEGGLGEFDAESYELSLEPPPPSGPASLRPSSGRPQTSGP
ncbi:MAG TPA: GNAT family N-acetyltransferase [Candidatus Dormibacteraeota bacterium]|nr:GNAT family N-acetyltransferase [Candidatus Dormibacteraeota bacterium]